MFDQALGMAVAYDESAITYPDDYCQTTGQRKRAAMTHERKRLVPREAVALDAKPNPEKVQADENRRPCEQDEREQDPRVEPIERR